MSIFNTENKYGAIAKLFHWVMALAILGMLGLGLYMTWGAFSPDKLKLYGIHKSIGAMILATALLRLMWRFANVTPKLPVDMPNWQKFGAHASHFALYFFMLAMPLSGWAMSSAAGFPVSVFGFFHLPQIVTPDNDLRILLAQLHEYMAYALIATIVAHAGAALHHHFIAKDDILKRMLP